MRPIAIIEEQRKELWRQKLEFIFPGWDDGDKESRHEFTVDLIHRGLKLAVELKTERESQREFWGAEHLSNRLQGYFESAEKKFANYSSEYRTILIIECQSSMEIVELAMTGIRMINPNNGWPTISRLRNVKMFGAIGKNIGSSIVCPFSPNLDFRRRRLYCYIPLLSHQFRQISNNTLEEIIGERLQSAKC